MCKPKKKPEKDAEFTYAAMTKKIDEGKILKLKKK